MIVAVIWSLLDPERRPYLLYGFVALLGWVLGAIYDRESRWHGALFVIVLLPSVFLDLFGPSRNMYATSFLLCFVLGREIPK